MFGSKPSIKKLGKKYDRLMTEGYKLSTIDRAKSDEKYAEAERVKKEIEAMQSQ